MCAFQIVPPLLPLLHEARERYGYMPYSAIKEIAREVRLPVASVLGICDSYDAFREHEPVLHIGVPDCPTNMIRGALGIMGQFMHGLGDLHHTVDGRKVIVEWASCHGHCFEAPYIVVNNHVYTHVKHGTVDGIIKKIHNGTYTKPREQPLTLPPFPALSAFEKAVNMGGEAVIKEITDAGLLGFGGALFAAGTKWAGSATANAKADPTAPRIVFVNFDEGEGGTCKDGAIVRGELPHFNVWTLLEGILIAAYAVRATHGLIYTRYEYPRELELLNRAIAALYENGLLGKNILKTGWSFELQTVRGAGGYVRGELTAGMSSAAGEMGIPRFKKVRTSECGYRGWPTLVNNVETFAWVTRIIKHGAVWYQKAGQPRIYTVSGDVFLPQVIEAPQTITLSELIELAGGLRGEKLVMAIPGGNATVPVTTLNVQMNKKGLAQVGSSPGSGACMVASTRSRHLLWEITRHVAAFFARESCQQCTLCRVWTRRAHTMLANGPVSASELEQLQRVIEPLKAGTLCGLGQGAIPPITKACEIARIA